MKKSVEPKWNQTFLYSHVHRRDFRERMLEITVWDQPRVQEEESEFLGEVRHTFNAYVIASKANASNCVCYYIMLLHDQRLPRNRSLVCEEDGFSMQI